MFLAKSRNKRLKITKVFKQQLPKEALEKSLPSDPFSFGVFLNEIINEKKIGTNRIALSLPSDACYTRLIELPEEVEENNSISFIDNPNSVATVNAIRKFIKFNKIRKIDLIALHGQTIFH